MKKPASEAYPTLFAASRAVALRMGEPFNEALFAREIVKRGARDAAQAERALAAMSPIDRERIVRDFTLKEIGQ